MALFRFREVLDWGAFRLGFFCDWGASGQGAFGQGGFWMGNFWAG